MQDNIRVTTPIQTNDAGLRIRPSKESPILNPIDPTRVTPQNGSENSQNAKNDGNFNMLLNHNSVFNRFIQQLAQTPGLSQTLKKIMFDAMVLGEKGTKLVGVDNLLAEMAQKLKMNPQQMVDALTYQSENQTKFTGQMFDMWREILSNNASNKEFQTLLGHFLKSYNGYFSTMDTLKAIIQNLKNIGSFMPTKYASQLEELTNQLMSTQPSASLDINLSTLKNQIIPFLSRYISDTNDFGKVRDTITLLINNIARLNTSSKEDIINKFVDLLDFCKYHFDLPDSKIDMFKGIFAQRLSDPQQDKNEMFEMLAKILSEGSGKDQSTTSRTMYKDITNALLMDNSVFMPLSHVFLPLNFNGQFMFSELWIDKDAEGTNAQTGERISGTKLFVTFDIKGLGYFEATVWISDLKAEIEISYPSTIENKDKEIRNTVSKIFSNNGISLSNLILAKGQPPKRLQDVFHNLYERRNGIDVSI